MNQTQNLLLADLIIDGKKSKESGLYISEMAFDEGISQVSKAVLTVCSNSLCLKLRSQKDQNGNLKAKGLLDYLDQKATICFLDNEKISRTFTGKITSVTHLGVSNTVSNNIYKYEFIVEPTIADMKQSHHTRQIKKTINDAIKEILSTYYGDATIDFVETESDKNIYLFYQQNETDYDFFLRLLTQFGLSFFVYSQKDQKSDEYFEQVIISDGKSFELPTATRPANSHTDRNLNILVNKSSKTKSKNIKISSWQMSNSTTIDEICRTDSLKKKDNDKRLWFLNSLATPHSETQTDEKTRDKVACNYLNSIRSSSANWFGTAHLNDFQATDILNIFDFYSPCNLDSEEKEKSALLSEDTIRARIVSLNLLLTNVLPFAIDSSALSPVAEVKFRCAEISKEAPSTYTTLANKDTLSPRISVSDSQAATIDNKVLNIFSGADTGLSIKKATVCYPEDISDEDLANLPKRNAQAKINIDKKNGECYFFAKIDNSTKCNQVLFTMPIAGLGQGLYRYPRIGERILVLDNKDSRYILLCYLPDKNTMPFFQGSKSDEEIRALLEYNGELIGLTEEQIKAKIKEYQNKAISLADVQLAEQSVATVLRHCSNNFMTDNKTEANLTDYLENESSKPFKAKLSPLNRNVSGSFKPLDYKGKDIKYSEIGMYSGFKEKDDKNKENKEGKWQPEVLRIQTPGNQYNHTGLTNLSTANDFVFSTPNATQEDANFGSFKVIDVGSVVIDAKKSITLKVAGNILSISESGISLVSQTTSTNNTPYDSTLSLTPVAASLSGFEVNVSGKVSANVLSNLGANISLSKGDVKIAGHTVELSTLDHKDTNFEIFSYSLELAKYLAFFIADQIEMKKRLETGYNEMVEDGYFNAEKLYYHMGEKSQGLKTALGSIDTVWGLITVIVNTAYSYKSEFPPSKENACVTIAAVVIDLLFGVFDAAMAVDIFGIENLSPEKIQREITIVNFIKITTKTVFMYIKMAALKSYKVGNISYMQLDPNEINAFSSQLKADFVNVSAETHNVPIKPIIPAKNLGLPLIPDDKIKAPLVILESSLKEVEGAVNAELFSILEEASGKVPAFALKSEEGSVVLDSNVPSKFKTNILTKNAELEVTSTENTITLTSLKTALKTEGKLEITANSGVKIASEANTININPQKIKITGSLLDMRTKILQTKSDAVLKFKGQAFNLDSKVLKINSSTTTVGSQLVKVG